MCAFIHTCYILVWAPIFWNSIFGPPNKLVYLKEFKELIFTRIGQQFFKNLRVQAHNFWISILSYELGKLSGGFGYICPVQPM